MLSSLVQIIKGKGDSHSLNLYRGIKLFEHVFKVLDGRLRKLVDIDKMQYGFMSGKHTVYAVFSLRRLAEKFRSKNKKLFFVFFDLGTKRSYSFYFESKGCFRAFDKWSYVTTESCKTSVSIEDELSLFFTNLSLL